MPGRTWIKAAVMLLVPLAVGCTRQNVETSQLNISVPGSVSIQSASGKFSTNTLRHLVINVSGPGMSPKLLVWDCNTPSCVVPSTFEMAGVDSGDDRLIQVLGAFGGEDSGIYFYYGDEKKKLAGGVEKARITITPVGGSTAEKQGTIAGRYYNSNGSTPTSVVSMKYVPPGKPAMIIEEKQMFAGWFSAFALENTKFIYELEDGSLLFGEPVSLSSSLFTSAKIMKITTPDHVREFSGGSSSESEKSTQIILGYFGNAPSALNACDPGSYTYSNRKLASGGTVLSFPNDFLVTGGSASCVGNEFVDHLKFAMALHDNQGRDSVGGFTGPFKKYSADHFIGQDSLLNWAYLPGIDSSVLSGIRLFARQNDASGNENRDFSKNGEINCDGLSALGFSMVADIAFPNTSVNPSVIGSMPNGGVVLICPYIGSRYYKMALETHVGGMGGGGGGLATSLAIMKNSQPFGIVEETYCNEYVAELRDASGARAMRALATPFTVSRNGSVIDVYSNPSDCWPGTNPISPTIPPNNSELRFYIKSLSYAATGPTHDQNYSINSSLASIGVNSVVVPSGSNTLFAFSAHTMAPDVCYPIDIMFGQMSGSSSPVGTDTIIDLANAGSGMLFHSDSSCLSAVSTVTLTNGTSFGLVYGKIPAPSTHGTISMSVQSGTPAIPAMVNFRKGSGTGTLAKLGIYGPSFIQKDQCAGPFNLEFQNSQNTPVMVAAGGPVFFTPAVLGITVHNTSACSSTYTSFSGNKFADQFWIKASNTGSATFTATFGAATGTMPVISNGLHSVFAAVSGGTPVANGACVGVLVTQKDVMGYPFASSPVPTTVTTSSAVHLDVGCSAGVTSFQIDPNTPSKFIYVRANNPTATAFNQSVNFTSAGLVGYTLNIPVNPPPAIIGFGLSTQDIAEEYVFNLEKAIQPFSGVPAFSAIKNTGGGTLGGLLYTPAGSSASFTVSDSLTNSFSLTTNIRARSTILDFSSSLPSGITLSRPSSANYINSSGFMVSAAPGSPRFHHNPDPASTHTPVGLLLEPSSQNLVPYSEDFLGTGWAAVNVPAPVGAAVNSPRGDATGVFEVADTNLDGNVAYLANTFVADLADGNSYVASIFVKKNTSNYFGFLIEDNTARSAGVVLDLNAGTVHPMQGPKTPQIAHSFGVEKYNNGWFRVWVRMNAASGCSCQGTLFIYPSHSSTGLLSGEPTSMGSVYLFGAQVEQIYNLTSYIVTTASPVSRSGDSLTFPIDGTTFPGMAANVGTFRVEMFVPSSNRGDNNTLLDICFGCSERVQFGLTNSFTMNGMVSASATGQPAAIPQAPLIKNALNTISVSYATGNTQSLAIGLNGVALHSGSGNVTAPNFSSGADFRLGQSAAGSVAVTAIKKIEYWPYQLSAPALSSF